MVKLTQRGNFRKTKRSFSNLKRVSRADLLRKYADEGLQALIAATPQDTGLTASSWYYEIIEDKNSITLRYNNRNVNDGVPIALVIQYGHAMPNGAYVEGIDYINPAIGPIFQKISDEFFEEIKNA